MTRKPEGDRFRWAMIGAVILLSLIGIAAAAHRTIVISQRAERHGSIARSDSLLVVPLTEYRAAHGGNLVAERYEFTHFAHSFDQHPYIAYLHLIPGILFMLLIPVQMSRVVRRRPTVHRWLGRSLLALCVAMIPAGLFFTFRYQNLAGEGEALPVSLIAAIFLYSGARGWAAIRSSRANWRAHREWMIRMYAQGLSISIIRLAPIVLIPFTGLSFHVMGGFGIWAGLIIATLGGEWWIRRTRVSERLKTPALAPLAS